MSTVARACALAPDEALLLRQLGRLDLRDLALEHRIGTVRAHVVAHGLEDAAAYRYTDEISTWREHFARVYGEPL